MRRILPSTLRQAIFFDADNTLWHIEQLYDKARNRFCKLMELLDFDSQLALEMQQITDLINFKTLGYSRKRFPLSFVQTYEVLCRRGEITSRRSIRKKIKKIGETVFLQKPRLIRGARHVLRRLSIESSLVLVSAGDPLIQRRRIRQSGLSRYFIATEVVEKKSPDVLIKIVRRNGFNPKTTWMVGDSIRSDINPALDAGLRAILIPRPNWRAEQDSPKDGEIYLLTDLLELPNFFRAPDKSLYQVPLLR